MHRMIFLEKDEIGKDNYRRLCNTGVIIFTDYETREISKDSIEYALSEEAIDTREIEDILGSGIYRQLMGSELDFIQVIY